MIGFDLSRAQGVFYRGTPCEVYLGGTKIWPHDYSKDYLTFTALESGTFAFTERGTGDSLQYSLDDGATWTSLASGVASPTVSAGDRIMWKGSRTPGGTTGNYGIGVFSATGNFDASGNIMSLLYGDSFVGQVDLTNKNHAFRLLFNNCNKLVNTNNLIFPATVLSDRCYTTMFRYCSSLISVPKLPAVTLRAGCYQYMFQACTSLTKAPELPATILVNNCYQYMFDGCTNINYIKCLATDISATDCLESWVDGVSATGTFVKADSMTNWPSGISGIPTWWDIYNENGKPFAEGYIRVAGSSNPELNYKSYGQDMPLQDSVFSLFYPCLVGTPLTGSGTEGKILHVLKKLGSKTATAEDTGFTTGQAVWEDLEGQLHAIDGSEGDVMIVNIEPYYRIMGKYTIDGTEYDVFLVNRTPFTWQSIVAELVVKGGIAPDYCVSHTDTDNVIRMHSVYNPAWDGSYSAPDSIVGKYIYAQNPGTGEITETYDATATVLGGAGGLHSTNLALYTGEQYAMNNNPDTTKCVPFMNETAASVEDMFALMLAEGGTFDAHNAILMGSGFSSNDPATAAADWEESGSGAKNGVRLVDKDGALKYYSLGTDAKSWTGKGSTFYLGQILNSWRNPFHIMEAHMAVSYAIQQGVHELEWFVFEGNKYKWRSVQGFNGPAQGEMTCVVWKMISSKCGANVVDPTDKTTSIEGNRIDFLISVALFHGMTTQVSPSWWISGLIFTEDSSQNYEAYMERDQESLIKSENGVIATSENFNFETLYKHVGSFTGVDGYAKNYSNDALMLPDTNANKTGGGLHTYVGKYNWFTGAAASSNKKSVRGFRRGSSAFGTYLSPLSLYALSAPSVAGPALGSGTCVRIVE